SFWAEDPPSRTRRLVTIVLVFEGSVSIEFLVTNNLLLIRNRLEMTNYPPLSAERKDTIVQTADGLKLRRREVIIEQSMVMMPNLAVFL
ncbi:MAG: ring hydroxylating beta subunit, partial [Rhizorhabdus sp.]|nr:ring hydroxylating beta subunit [Rhizorhabdus sp.]